MFQTLVKQPNDKYCILDSDGKVILYNLIEQDIINMYIEYANNYLNNAKPYGDLIKKTIVGVHKERLNPISDHVLNEMGFDKTYTELVKYIPLRPVDKAYAPCDFTTYAECPQCGGTVQDGIGHTDKQCKCGQLLNWK